MIRDITDLFNRNLINIIGINLLLVIPFTFFIYSSINYFYLVETVEMKNLIVAFLIIINFTALFPPFFYIAIHDLNDESLRFKEMLKVFFEKFGYIVFFTLIFYLIGIFGYFLLYIPTLIAMMVILLLPLYSDQDTIKNSLSGVWRMVKKENIFILLDVLIILFLNVLVWFGSLYLLAGFENNNLVYLTIRVLLNALLFPLIYFYLTLKYRRDLSEEYVH